MSRAILLSVLALGLLALTGCSLAAQPPAATPAAAPVATTVPQPTSNGATASRGATPTSVPKPSTIAAKPTTGPAPAGAATSSAVSKPAAQASPAPSTAARAEASPPPAVVATSVAGLPVVASPGAASEPRGAQPADTLGVAASAGSAAAAATGADAEATALCGPGAILSTRAGQAAGRQATVAIAKVEASYQPTVRGQPTFLNDAPYPNHVFTAVIWGSDRRQFDPPLTSWQGKALCVTGAVELYQQRPQIVVSAPSQLRAAR